MDGESRPNEYDGSVEQAGTISLRGSKKSKREGRSPEFGWWMVGGVQLFGSLNLLILILDILYV